VFNFLAALNPVISLIVGYVLPHHIDDAKVQIDQTKLRIEENSAKLADLTMAAEASSIVVHDRVDKVKVISEITISRVPMIGDGGLRSRLFSSRCRMKPLAWLDRRRGTDQYAARKGCTGFEGAGRYEPGQAYERGGSAAVGQYL
jgi:hypothetical protein